MDVPDGGAPQEHRRAEDRGEPHHAVALEGEKADGGEAETGVADLGLERAVGPADEARRHLAEEDVEDEVVEVAEADREQDEVGEQLLRHVGAREAVRLAGDGDRRRDQPQDEERQGEIPQRECDQLGHRPAFRSPSSRF